MTERTTMRQISALGIGLLLIPSGLSAQAHEMPGQSHGAVMMGQGMGSGMLLLMGQSMGVMATGGPGPAMILSMRETLDLTDDQSDRLEAIQAEYTEAAEPHMPVMLTAHEDARTALDADPPDLVAYERALREGADGMVKAHVAMAVAVAKARDVLTTEQREQLPRLGMGHMMHRMTGSQMNPGMF